MSLLLLVESDSMDVANPVYYMALIYGLFVVDGTYSSEVV